MNNLDKNVIINFDDGREDVYLNAYPIMRKYDLVCSIYLITGTLDNSFAPKTGFASGKRKFLNKKEIDEMKKMGYEFSSHSNNHSNDKDMISKSINYLKKNNLFTNFVSFSSPRSEINEANFMSYDLSDLKLNYLRTGIQMKNEKFLSKVFFILQKVFKSKLAFYFLNKKNVMKKDEKFFIKTVAIRNYNTVKQIEFLLNKIKPNETVVLLFHSVTDDSKSLDDWGFAKDKFEKICLYLKEKNFNNLTTQNYILK